MKSFYSPFHEVIKVTAITVVIWMIWRMENHSRFQNPIVFSYAIFSN